MFNARAVVVVSTSGWTVCLKILPGQDRLVSGLLGLIVTSLARPGGSLTGMSNQSADLPGKRLELLRGIAPNLPRVAVMTNVGARIGMLESSFHSQMLRGRYCGRRGR
jgi:hypothetical protein